MKLESKNFRLEIELGNNEQEVVAEVLAVISKVVGKQLPQPTKETFVPLKKERHDVTRLPKDINTRPAFGGNFDSEQQSAPARAVLNTDPKAKSDAPDNKFLIGQCTCGERHFLYVYDNGRPYDFVCKKCGLQHQVDFNKLVTAIAECECGQSNTFFMNPNDKMKHLNCKKCNAKLTVKRADKIKRHVTCK